MTSSEASDAADRVAIGFSASLRGLCAELEITPADLVRDLGVSSRTVSRWWAGSLTPSMSNLLQLARYLGVPVTSLLREASAASVDLDQHGALEACRLALQGERLVAPHDGVRFDYLCLGTWVPEQSYRSLLLALKRADIGTERISLVRGVLRVDGRTVGTIQPSKGSGWDEKRKVLWHFSGTFFRSHAQGGCDLTPADAQAFVAHCITAIVAHARQQVHRPQLDEYGDDTRRHPALDPACMRLDAIAALRDLEQQSGLIDAEVLRDQIAAVRASAELEQWRAELEASAVARVSWDDLTEWPIKLTVIERVDWSCEARIAPGVRPRDLEDVLLPHGYGWAEGRTSRDGQTIYASRSKHPLARRGEMPLITAYREVERPDVLRVEVRVPRVTYHDPRRAYGVQRAADLARDLIAAVVPWPVRVEQSGRVSGDPLDLAVPALHLGDLPCVEVDQDQPAVSVRPFTGHPTKTRRRLLRQGLTLLTRYATVALLASSPLGCGDGPEPGPDHHEPAEEQPRAYDPQELDAMSIVPADLEDLVRARDALDAYRAHYYPNAGRDWRQLAVQLVLGDVPREVTPAVLDFREARGVELCAAVLPIACTRIEPALTDATLPAVCGCPWDWLRAPLEEQEGDLVAEDPDFWQWVASGFDDAEVRRRARVSRPERPDARAGYLGPHPSKPGDPLAARELLRRLRDHQHARAWLRERLAHPALPSWPGERRAAGYTWGEDGRATLYDLESGQVFAAV